ncbi:MAG: protein kinase, partial [Planctomycetota bacterium]
MSTEQQPSGPPTTQPAAAADRVEPPVQDETLLAVRGDRALVDASTATWISPPETAFHTPLQPGGYVGHTIGEYRLERLLGVGGMGAVYLARTQRATPSPPVAVKLLAPHLAADSQVQARFIREAQAQAKLNHPNIARVHSAGDERGTPYIVMDLLSGGDLSGLIRERKRLDEHEAVGLWIPLLEALDYAHTRGYVHRDIKPGNVMLDGLGKPYLADFGLVGTLGSDASSHKAGPAITAGSPGDSGVINLTATGDVLGTPAFMSPEQCAGKQVDQRGDLYSFGCLMFVSVTGQLPFRSSLNLFDVLRQQMEKPAPNPQSLVPHISDDVSAVILRLMEKRPEDRFPTGAEVARVLRGGYLSDYNTSDRQRRRAGRHLGSGRVVAAAIPEPAATDFDSRRQPPARSIISWRLVVAVLIVLVAAVGVVGAFGFLPRQSENRPGPSDPPSTIQRTQVPTLVPEQRGWWSPGAASPYQSEESRRFVLTSDLPGTYRRYILSHLEEHYGAWQRFLAPAITLPDAPHIKHQMRIFAGLDSFKRYSAEFVGDTYNGFMCRSMDGEVSGYFSSCPFTLACLRHQCFLAVLRAAVAGRPAFWLESGLASYLEASDPGLLPSAHIHVGWASLLEGAGRADKAVALLELLQCGNQRPGAETDLRRAQAWALVWFLCENRGIDGRDLIQAALKSQGQGPADANRDAALDALLRRAGNDMPAIVSGYGRFLADVEPIPGCARLQVAIRRAMKEGPDRESAAETVADFARRNPRYGQGLNYYEGTLAAVGQREEARKLLLQAADQEPTNGNTLFGASRIAAEL